MRQPTIAFLAFLTCAALPAGAQTAAPESFGERIEVNTVNVDVRVLDRAGRPVTGLQRGDFTLLEDGKSVAITNFDAVTHHAAAVPVEPGASPAIAPSPSQDQGAASWVLFVDDVYIHPAHRTRVLNQLRTFLTTELSPGDQVMLATYDHGLHVRLPFSTDRAALDRALDTVEKLAGGGNELDRARGEALHGILQVLGDLDIYGKPEGAGGRNKREPKDDEGDGPAGKRSNSNLDEQCPANIAESVHAYAAAVRHEVLSSIGALTVLVNSLSGVPGRKVLLHISDGLPLTPGEDLFQVLYQICGGGAATSGLQGLPVFSSIGSNHASGYDGGQSALDAQAYSTAREWTALTSHANAQRVTLYTLQASGAETIGADAEMGPAERVLALPEVASIESLNRQQPLSAMASDTGGKAIFWANDIRPELARIQEDLATYYSLGFNPSHTGDGREHRLTVKVKKSGVTLRYRQSYRDKPALERTVDRTLASLYYGFEDNPLDVQLEVGDRARTGKDTWAVPFHLRIPLYKLTLVPTATAFEGKLRLLVATQTDGKQSPLRQVEVPIKIAKMSALTALGQFYLYEVKLTLEPGEQHVAIAVRDEASTTTSFLARSLKLDPPGASGRAR